MNMRKKPHYSGGGRSGGSNNNNNNKRRFTRKPGGGSRFNNGGDDSDSVNPRMRKQAQTNRDKYLGMAKDALSSGDRVESEYYLQHAEHYLRILNAIDAQFAQRQPVSEPQDQENEGEEIAAEEAEAPQKPVTRQVRSGAEVQAQQEEQNDGAQLAAVLPAARTAGA